MLLVVDYFAFEQLIYQQGFGDGYRGGSACGIASDHHAAAESGEFLNDLVVLGHATLCYVWRSMTQDVVVVSKKDLWVLYFGLPP
jgi:hypothetical protein